MAKRNPSTGKFEKRADGKIIKPPGWKAPDVEGEMGRQFKEGSWSQSGSVGAVTPSEHVREFTAGAGQPTPDTPELMTAEEVHFITKMIIDETLELWATLFTSDEAVAALVDIIETAKKLPKEGFSDDEQGHIDQVAAQADALVDIQYYMLNCAAKKGINMSAIFGVVQ
jgi:predicted HAD superfamily Cof-like phosphohydrolase